MGQNSFFPLTFNLFAAVVCEAKFRGSNWARWWEKLRPMHLIIPKLQAFVCLWVLRIFWGLVLASLRAYREGGGVSPGLEPLLLDDCLD